MQAVEVIHESCRNLLLHKARSALTLLGVIFGVASVITMMAIGEGAQENVLRELSGLGLRNIIISSERPGAVAAASGDNSTSRLLVYGLTEADLTRFHAAQPPARLTSTLDIGEKVYIAGKRLDAKVSGVLPEYFSFFRTRLVSGRMISDTETVRRRHVALVTQSLLAQMRERGLVADAALRIGGHYFEIVGVVDVAGEGVEPRVYIPRSTASVVYGSTTMKREAGSMEFVKNEVGSIILQADREEDVPGLAAFVARTLEPFHALRDYRVTVPLDLLRSRQRTQRIFNLVLVTIASISLLVGGIGIMNIMLATVAERIPEIGIRRAIGATRRDIFLQFLSETVTLSTLGGALGCVVGLGILPIAEIWMAWEGIVTGSAILVALVVSWLVGVVFGTAPAVHAARQHPVESLRHE